MSQNPSVMHEGLQGRYNSMSLDFLILAIFVALVLVLSSRNVLLKCDVSSLEILPTWLKDKVVTIAYLNNGAKMIEHQYRKSPGRPFVLQTPGKQIFVVSSRKHIKELNQAPPATLSMHAVAKEIMQPIHSMQGFDMSEQRGAEGLQFVHAIRKDFTSQLPNVFTILEKAVVDELSRVLTESKIVDGKHQVRLFSMANRLTARANCTACFGAELDPKIVTAAMHFVMDSYIAGEIIRAVPKFMALPIASLATRRYRACRILFDSLCATIERRRSLAELNPRTEKAVDGLQNIIDASPKDGSWTAARIAHDALGIFFFSVLGLTNTIAFALADLCTHNDYTRPLRQELAESWNDFERDAEGLPLLDSFLKESTRLNGTEWVSGRRKALAPFTFTDGPHVPTGSWIYIPTGSINRDAENFTDPLRFDGFRFARGKRSPFTDTSGSSLLWGTGRVICPGRFYSSMIIKMVLAIVLRGYECELCDHGKPQSFMWRSSILPRMDLVMLMRSRREENLTWMQRSN